MKKFVVLAFTATIALGVSLTSCNTKGGNVRLSSPVDTAAYAIGVANGEGFRMMLESFPGEDLDVDKLLAGLEAALKGDSSSMKMTSAEARDFLNEYVMLAQIKEAEKSLLTIFIKHSIAYMLTVASRCSPLFFDSTEGSAHRKRTLGVARDGILLYDKDDPARPS